MALAVDPVTPARPPAQADPRTSPHRPSRLCESPLAVARISVGSAAGNGINYQFAPGNHAGKIAKTKKGEIFSPNAWANFAF